MVAQLYKICPRNAEDPGSIAGSGRSPGERRGNPFLYSCLENPQGQRSLVGYSPWGSLRVRHGRATKRHIERTSTRPYCKPYKMPFLPGSTKSPGRA